MNAISYALNMVTRQIPPSILQLAFVSNFAHITTVPISINSRIREVVIKDRVLVDINIIGGTHITVPLDGLPQERIENNAIVVRIPKDRTQGRSIISAHSVAFGSAAIAGYSSNPLSQTGDVGNAQQQLLNGISSIPYISEAQVTLLTENVVMIQGVNMMSGMFFLRCEVENDSNLNNIKRRSYLAFGKLVTLAVKSYIHNALVVAIDIGYIEGGATIGRISEIINDYAEAEADYLEFLETKWSKVSKLNDSETVEQLVRISTGGLY